MRILAGYIWQYACRLVCVLGLVCSKHYTLEVNAGVKNLLDHFQRDLDKGMDRDAGYVYGPATPRTFFAGISLKI